MDTLEAGVELNRKIAMLLGYRIEEHNSRYYLHMPDGRYVFGNGTQFADELRYANGRSDATVFFAPGGDVPDWSGSVDSALSLVPPATHCQLTQSIKPAKGWLASVGREIYIEFAYTAAEAICFAWLAWKEAETEGVQE